MTGERCKHELLISSCADCRPQLPSRMRQRPGLRLDLGIWFQARYPGKCSACEEHISPGDYIRSDGAGGYLCDGCGNLA